jgi:hypothetical protein
MPATARLAERAAAAGLFGAVAFNAPLIELFDRVGGSYPGLVVYVFVVWGLLVAAVATVMRRARPPGPGG